MGLAIARELVEAHGGRIWAESEGANCGSRFVISLPLARDDA
jgi:signal transduction histidine kinase